MLCDSVDPPGRGSAIEEALGGGVIHPDRLVNRLRDGHPGGVQAVSVSVSRR